MRKKIQVVGKLMRFEQAMAYCTGCKEETLHIQRIKDGDWKCLYCRNIFDIDMVKEVMPGEMREMQKGTEGQGFLPEG